MLLRLRLRGGLSVRGALLACWWPPQPCVVQQQLRHPHTTFLLLCCRSPSCPGCRRQW